MADLSPETSLASPPSVAGAALSVLLSASMDAVLIMGPNGAIQAANEAASGMLGYSAAEMREVGRDELFGAAGPALAEALAAAERTGFFRGAIGLARRGGEKFPAEISIASYRDGSGQRQAHLVIRDQSERERAEAVLRSGALRYRTITATTTDGCWEVDNRGRILEANDRCVLQYGYAREELLGMSVKDFEATRNPEETAKHIQEIQRFGYARFETRHRCKDGRILNVEVSTTYQPDSGTFVAFLRDITARKRAEIVLKETEERYRGLVDSAFNGCVVHQHGIILSVNAAYAATFGYSAEELAGRPVLDVVAPESRDLVAAVFRDGKEASYAATGLRKDGSRIPIEVSGKTCFIDGGAARIAVVRDLTERRRAEAEREKLQAQLHHSQKMESVGRLAGGVAHDFNNMLTAIQCNVTLALEALPGDSPLRENLDQILQCAQRSSDLTRQLLAFARKQTIDPHVVDLNATVAGTLRMLQRIIGEDIELIWRPTDGLWTVKIDSSQVDQLLANLCVNARDAIRGVGQVTLELANVAVGEAIGASNPDAVAGEYVMLGVKDTGCGMDQEVMAHLFEPFFTTKEVGHGTGLGLATIYGIVKQNGGFIAVESSPGAGATFKVYLPRNAEVARGPAAEPAAAPLSRGSETILFVEDEYSILRVGKLMLERLGYRVLTASKPGEAVRLSEEHAGEIHLLLTDVVMPEMNGKELAQRLLERHPGLRVVFMSGYTANVIAPHGVLEPGVLFIQKPFTTRALADMIRAALKG